MKALKCLKFYDFESLRKVLTLLLLKKNASTSVSLWNALILGRCVLNCFHYGLKVFSLTCWNLQRTRDSLVGNNGVSSRKSFFICSMLQSKPGEKRLVLYHEQGHRGHCGLAKAIMIRGTPICWLCETLLVLSSLVLVPPLPPLTRPSFVANGSIEAKEL